MTAHARYRTLGRNAAERQETYRGLFRDVLDASELKELRAAWLTGTPLGNDRFRMEIERSLKIKVGQARRGRPQKPRKGL